MKRLARYFAVCLALGFAGALLRWPQEARAAASEGLTLALGTVLPSLFPFFVLSALLPALGVSQALGRLLEPLMAALFHLSGAGAGALALGLLGGYPTGARAVSELYAQRLCSRDEAERLLAFCNNCGPAFFLSFLGAGCFGSVLSGVRLYLIHVLAALLTGMLLRPRCISAPRTRARAETAETPLPLAFVQAVQSGLGAFFSVASFVILFSVLLRPVTGLLGGGAWLGIMELFTGAAALGSTAGDFILAAVLTGFGGLSVHAQAAAFFLPAGLRGTWYLRGKLLHAALSGALAALYVLL